MVNGKSFTRTKFFFRLIGFFILLTAPFLGFSQYDYEHYVPPFYCGSSNENDVGRHTVVLSTNSENNIQVYIEKGDGTALAGPFTITRGAPVEYIFETGGGEEVSSLDESTYPEGYDFSFGVVGPHGLNKKLDEGLRIYSYDGPFFANIRHRSSVHGGSLTAKGTYAKGTDFRSGHLYNHSVYGSWGDIYRPRRSHFISVMAIEDTEVTFSDIKCSYLTEYNAGVVSLKPIAENENITVSLSKGESYIIAVDFDFYDFYSLGTDAWNGMNGTHITSTNPIVVNTGSWTAGSTDSQEIGIDQIVPSDQMRDKYVVMRGRGRDIDQERTIVVALEDNTEVWVNGAYATTIAESGDFVILDDMIEASGKWWDPYQPAFDNLYIDTKDKNVYVYQTMCGDDTKTNIGLNFIPPLSSTGMKEVTIPFSDYLAEQQVQDAAITILTQKNAEVEYQKTVNGVTTYHTLATSDAIAVNGTTEWVSYIIQGDVHGNYRFNSNKAINVAWTVRDGWIGAAGYYSGFTKAISKIVPEIDVIDGTIDLICESYEGDIQVSLKEPLPDFYEWYVEDFTQDPFIKNGPLVVPAPDKETSYHVIGYFRDTDLDILFNGDFSDGYNGFDSDYEKVTEGLTEQRQFAITSTPVSENPILKDFGAKDGGRMFVGYSDRQGEIVYQVSEMPVEEKFNYIFKMYGRLAQDGSLYDQSLKVLVNNDTIIQDFRIDSSNEWQSSAALWSPGDARKATIKVLNNNLDTQDTFFALDSISFVQAVQDTAVFVARVVPNYSYGNDGETFHFCEGVQNSIDVSHGDTSWYEYSWSKKDEGTETYIDLVDNEEFSDTDTHELTFLDPQEANEGSYRCTISFKEEYQDCATTQPVDVDVQVLVDKDANVRIEDTKNYTCVGSSITLNALVEGSLDEIKWFVDDSTVPDFVGQSFKFPANETGTFSIRCEATNGCGTSSDEITINVLSYPELTSLVVDDKICEGQTVELIATATGEGTLTYYWAKGTESLNHNESTYSFVSSLDNKSDIYSVSVASVYTIGGESVECRSEVTEEINGFNIIPQIDFPDLEDVTLCEGVSHLFEADVTGVESDYNFKWYKDDVLDTEKTTSSYVISPVALSDAGTYKVEVSNDCFDKTSSAQLSVTAKMVVNSISTNLTGPFCSSTDVTVTFDDNGNVAAYRAKKPDGTEITITNPYTFEINSSTQGTWEFIADPNCTGESVSQKFTWKMIPDFGSVSMNDITTCIGKDVDFIVDVDDVSTQSELTYEWKDNTNTVIAGADTDVLSLTNVQDTDLGTYTCTVTDQCGRSKAATATLSIEKVTTATTAATIEKCVGDTDFRIDIAYIGTPVFEWRFNDPAGTVISNDDFYEIASLTVGDAGIYYCKVTLGCGDEINITRKLVVNEHVSIVNPADETIDICEGEEPVLEVSVNGNPDDYTVTWTDDSDNPLVGFGDVDQVQLSAHITVGTFTYKAKVSSFCDNLSKTYTVEVHEKPKLTTADNSMEECSGLVSLNVTASGEHNGIEWWKDGALITDGNADPADYVITSATSPDDDGVYIAKVSSDYCGDKQVSINLDVRNTIIVTGQSPVTTTVCENDAVSLFVTANGDDIEYQWYKNDVIITDATSATYSLGNVSLADAGTYKVSLSNDLGCGDQTLSFDVVVNKNPSVTNPSDQVICETQASVDFTVVGDAQGTVNYQWYDKDDIAVGTNSATLTINTPIDGQSYYCVVSGDACGTATSEKATLTIIKEVAVTDPIDQNIADGANATFSVTASGEPDYSYQWQENSGPGWNNISDGGKYSGANTTTLTITNADKTTFDENQYRCIVTSSGTVCSSEATSDYATLTINKVVKIASQPTGATACEGADVDLTIEGYFDALTYTWQYDNGSGSGYQDAVGDHSMTSSEVGKVSTLTIPSVHTGMNTWKFRCLVSDGTSTDEYSNEVSITVLEDIAVSTADASFTPCVDAPFSITVTATAGDDIKYKWYKVGDESNILSTSATYNFGNIALADEGDYKCEIYNDLHCNDITRTFGVDVKEHATVTDPVDVVMCSTDANPVFSVTAGGDGPFTYQWNNSTGAITGATNNSYTETTPVDGESYYCEVTNSCNTVTSKSAKLTVVEPLSVTDPVDLTIADGANATFSVTASGEPDYSYQWQENSGSGWSNISDGGKYSGANTASLTITGADMASFDGNQYQCIVNTSGVVCITSVTSGTAMLTITSVDKILLQPENDEVCFNDNATLSVEGNIAGLDYTWQYDNGSGSGYQDAVGDHSMTSNEVGKVSTLTIPSVHIGMNTWKFRCLVSDGTSTDEYSNEVSITVLEDIAVSTADASFTPCVDAPFSITVTATAGDDIKYKWYKVGDESNILSTSATYNFGNIALADEGDYKCEIYNDLHCNDITRTFGVDVLELVTVNSLTDKELCASATPPTFIVTAGGDGPYTYQWHNSSGIIAGANTDTYTVSSLVDGESYYCEVSNSCNTVNSNAAVVTVLEEVAITNEPVDISIVDGDDAEFAVVATGEPVIIYQWQEDSGSGFADITDNAIYSGVNTATLTIKDADKANFDGNQYRCIVDNGCSVAQTSAEVNLTVNSLIKILEQPQNLQVCEGDAGEFVIKGTSDGLIYDWEYSTDGTVYNSIGSEASLSDEAITNGSKLKIDAATTAMNNWTFRCIVKDGSSTDDISNVVSIEVLEPVNFIAIDDQNLCFGESKQIELTGVTGTGDLTYSWTKDATEVSITKLLTIADTDNGNYQVTVSNGVCPDVSDDFTVDHHSALSIDDYIIATHICVGNTETLTATVNVDPDLAGTTTYEWFKDDVSIGTTLNYNLVVADKNQSGQYKFVVNDGCSTESMSEYINVYEPITRDNDWTSPLTLCVGDELSLEVQVSGDVKSYTWTHNGAPITANSTYLVSAVTTASAGTYECTVADECGNTIVYTTNVSIKSIPEIADGIETLPGVCEGDPLVLGPISVTGSYDEVKWTLNDGSEDDTSGLALDRGNATTAMEGNYTVAVTNMCGTDVSVGTQAVNPTPGLDPIDNQTVCEGEDVTFRATTTGRDLHYQWKMNGVDMGVDSPELLINGTNVLPADPFTKEVYSIECIVTNDNGCGTSLTETAELTVNPSTILKATLKNTTKFVGDDYSMTIDITGADLDYSWTHVKDGVTTPLSYTGPTINFTNIQLSDAGYYNCVVTGACGTRLASGKLTVKEPVVVRGDLVNFEEKCEGEPLSLSIDATGQISSVTWSKNGTDLSHSELTYYIPELSLIDAGTYTCHIEGEGIDGVDITYTVRVYPNTILNSPIGNDELCEGEELNWVPDVSGAADLTYKWMFDGAEVSTDRILHYDAITLSQEGDYEVQVTGLCGDVTSKGNLEVIELPTVLNTSESKEVCENSSLVEFTVEATGENLRYQWRKNGTDIGGKTTPILSLTSIQLDDEAIYNCRVYNSCGEAISTDIALTVIPQLKILSEPVDVEVCAGEEVTFTAEVEGNDVVYQWKRNNIDIAGETKSVLNIGATDVDDDGYYTCTVSDLCTDSRSTKPTKLTVNELPNSKILGRMVLCAKEDRVTYITVDQPEINYGWDVDGGIFAGPEEGAKTRVTWSEAANGELSIIITDMDTGCKSRVDSLVTLNALPSVKLSTFESKGVCEESFQLSGGYPEGGIYWVDGISEEIFDPSDKGPGTYNVHYSYTDENGCSNITEIKALKVDILPTVDITDDMTIGSCSPFLLTAETKENNIQWSPADNLDDPNSMTPTFTPGESQVLTARVMDEHGCIGVDLVELTVAPLPIVTTIADTTVGQCNQLQLLTDVVGDAGEITWTHSDHLDDPDTRSPRIVNAPEGTYTYKINVVDLYGCDASGEVTVNVVGDPTLDEDQFGCEGDQFEVNIAGMQNPVWDDGYTDEGRLVEVPGTYKLRVSNEYGCGDEQTFVINPTPELGLKDTLIFEGENLTLGPNLPLEFGPYFFEWQDGSILQRFEVLETGMYKLRVEDNLGCITVDSAYVEVKPVGIESANAFLPNSDGLGNDKFYLQQYVLENRGVIQDFEMYIYNRWGELLYKTDEVGQEAGWDGRYKGKLCPAGAYVWMVFINGELTNKGTLMLVR